MRLLNTRTLQLEEFFTNIPKYAILSHTWGKEEVTFHDIQNLEFAKQKVGFPKIFKACAHARKYNFEWIWIDSCCINKESSAELSEAINSMYQYYEDAEACYAYLCDTLREEDPDPRYTKLSLMHCRWFKRGWTLQELLAPSYVVFLDKDWTEIGTRWSLRDILSSITSIPSRVFEDAGSIETFSIAQRMSWAALRETTRPEDQAYCLMGLFGVSMSPIYGEGSAKAFMRLQQEIIKISDDRSIFAWRAPVGENEPRGLFARSPSEFRLSSDVGLSESIWDSESSYSFANNGLHIHLPLVPTNSQTHSRNCVFIASLHCRSEKDGRYFSVYLKNTVGRQFVRCQTDELALDHFTPALKHLEEVIVKENPTSRCKTAKKKSSGTTDTGVFHVRLPSRYKITCLQPCLSKRWAVFNERTGRIEVGSLELSVTAMKCRVEETDEEFAVIIGFDVLHSIPRFKIVTGNNLPETADDLEDVLPTTESEPRRDRILERLESGGMISLAIQMTGKHSQNHRILEIEYIPERDPNAGAMTRYLEPPKTHTYRLQPVIWLHVIHGRFANVFKDLQNVLDVHDSNLLISATNVMNMFLKVATADIGIKGVFKCEVDVDGITAAEFLSSFSLLFSYSSPSSWYKTRQTRASIWNYFHFPPCLRITYPQRLLITYPGFTPKIQLPLPLHIRIPVIQLLDISLPAEASKNDSIDMVD